MSETYLYLSLIPETLVASMLPPEKFGKYLSIGTQKRMLGEAIYFDLKPGFESDFFNLSKVSERCVPHLDGSPKHTVHLSIYRVLEHIPLSALNQLHLVTRDGRVLSLQSGDLPTAFNDTYYLYDEICPTPPLVASKLSPPDFCRYITDPATSLHVPRLAFAQLNSEAFLEMASESQNTFQPLHYLPERVKFCFSELDSSSKKTKTVNRSHALTCGWQHIKNGYYVGDHDNLLYYPLPSREVLDRDHHDWWRSASL